MAYKNDELYKRFLIMIIAGISVFFSSMPEIKLLQVNISFSDIGFLVLSYILIIYYNFNIKIPLIKGLVLWVIGIFFLTLGLLLSSFNAINPLENLQICIQYLFVLLLLPSILIKMDHIQLILLIKIYIFGVSMVSLLGILTYFHINIFFTEYIIISGNFRLASLMSNPNTFGSLLAANIPLTLYIYIKNYINISYMSFIILVLLIGIILSGSFGAILILLICLFTFLILLSSFRINARLLILLVPLMVILYYLYTLFGLPEIFMKRVLSINNVSEAGSINDRIYLNSYAFKLISEMNFFGYGSGYINNFTGGLNVHNVFLSIWLDGGYLSIIGYILILSLLFFHSIKLLVRKNKLDGAISVTLVLSIILFSFNTTHIYGRHWFVPLILVICLLVNNKKNN